MKIFLQITLCIAALCLSGCLSIDKLPSEDIEVLEKHADIISVLRNPEISPNSKEKYEAAQELIKHVDLYFTRETATVDKLLCYRDASVDAPDSDNPVFTFTYQYQNKALRIRFFTYRMFVLRVEIKENE